MSGMFWFQSIGAVPFTTRITGNTATTIVDATDEMITVPFFQVNLHHTSDTPTLTVDLWDGTNAVYLGAGGKTWNAVTLTTKQSVDFTNGIVVPKGTVLRVTSSDAQGELHVYGVKVRNK